MTPAAISLLSRRGGACPAPRHAPSPSVIPGETRTASSPRVFCGENLSYSFSGGFSVGGVDFADGVAGFPAASFPTVKYLRIFLRRFAPSPRIASKSTTLLKAPHDLRICKILSAVAGTISPHQLQFFRGRRIEFTGLAGCFFLPASTDAARIKPTKRKVQRSRIGNRRAMTII